VIVKVFEITMECGKELHTKSIQMRLIWLFFED